MLTDIERNLHTSAGNYRIMGIMDAFMTLHKELNLDQQDTRMFKDMEKRLVFNMRRIYGLPTCEVEVTAREQPIQLVKG